MTRKCVLFLLALSVAIQIQAKEQPSDKIEKVYLPSECVRIEKGALFVFLQNQWVQTQSIHSDSVGLYVDAIKFLPWYCSNCSRWTTGWFCCEHCGALPD